MLTLYIGGGWFFNNNILSVTEKKDKTDGT